MRRILSEKSIVVLLFVLTLVVFSMAHHDTRKMELRYNKGTATTLMPSNPQQANLTK